MHSHVLKLHLKNNTRKFGQHANTIQFRHVQLLTSTIPNALPSKYQIFFFPNTLLLKNQTFSIPEIEYFPSQKN